MRKRYMITMDDETHRRLAEEAKLARLTLGDYLKAIETDKVTVDKDGTLSKGLGPLPGRKR